MKLEIEVYNNGKNFPHIECPCCGNYMELKQIDSYEIRKMEGCGLFNIQEFGFFEFKCNCRNVKLSFDMKLNDEDQVIIINKP